MDLVVVCAVALVVSGLTLFSGFGLGTLLMPAFALFFPLEVAVAATAVVHLANNLLKTGIFIRSAVWGVVARFALPAVGAAFLGAALLGVLSELPPLATWHLGSHEAEITPIKLVMALLMVGFAGVELLPRFRDLEFGRRWLPLGGVLSGFFGGLSGHQGALRAAFLARMGLTTAGFVATAAVSSLLVDLARLGVYGVVYVSGHMDALQEPRTRLLVAAATGAAFVGVVVGRRFVRKVTMRGVQTLTGVLLLLVAAGLASGLV